MVRDTDSTHDESDHQIMLSHLDCVYISHPYGNSNYYTASIQHLYGQTSHNCCEALSLKASVKYLKFIKCSFIPAVTTTTCNKDSLLLPTVMGWKVEPT